MDVFSWDDRISSIGWWELAKSLEGAKRFEPAVEAYEKYLSYDQYRAQAPPSVWDSSYAQPTSWIDKQIEAMYRIGRILHGALDDEQEAAREYGNAVRRMGAAHFHGPDIIAGLTELGAKPAYDEKSALIWGGGTIGLRSWQKVLEPKGFTVHAVRRQHVSASDLSPYPLVILIRSGPKLLTPADILGLRSYVATGGSLLMVVSPAYEGAAPGLLNGVLAFFGASAQHNSVDRATSTAIVTHPITKNVQTVTARGAVALEVPAETGLIESNGKTILAALDYRHGRVVLSSFGQWFLPDLSFYSERWQTRLRRRNSHATSSLPVVTLPLEPYSGANRQLIDNVVAWLTEPRPSDEEITKHRAELAGAWLAQQQYEAQAISREDLALTMDRLVTSMTHGIWKEEALWLAGEALMRLQYMPNGGHCYALRYRQPNNTSPLFAQPTFFEQLVKQFPDSPLAAYAQWRLGDCAFGSSTLRRSGSARSASSTEFDRALTLWKEVDAPKGSHAWAWKHLRIGNWYSKSGRPEGSIPHFREVSEQMGFGPEDTIALLNLGASYAALKQTDDAKRAYAVVLKLPNIIWWERGLEHWAPPGSSLSGSHRVARKAMRRLRLASTGE